jgi:hypothetical protein
MRGRYAAMMSLVLLVSTGISADERLKGIACRSVHLGYPAPDGTVFYNTLRVEQTADGTYFAVCGWDTGYFGIQQLADGKKVILFSVWDPTSGDDPAAVPPEKRVKLLDHDPAVRVGRFGNEGTGGQAFFDFDWDVDVSYRFMVIAQPDATDRTAYSGYFYVPQERAWKRLVTFSTLTTRDDSLRGYYSFVEDFKRDRVSATQPRRATFGNGWVRSADGVWTELMTARFTADANPVTNIDAGQTGTMFFLATGGPITNATTPLGELITRTANTSMPPDDLPLPK